MVMGSRASTLISTKRCRPERRVRGATRESPHRAELRRVREDASKRDIQAADAPVRRFPQATLVYPTLTEKIHSYTIAAS
jgi:hypothetical protein